MGLPARKLDSGARRQPRKAKLRVVSANTGRKKAKRRSAASSASSAQRVFVAFALVITVIAALGVGRVWLTVQAAEASLEAGRLRSEIKEARYAGDMLEIRQSALGSPSRIRAIADQAMGMAPAEEITYLELTEPAQESAPVEVAAVQEMGVASGGSWLKHAVASALDMAAGEAQTLLIGGAGLASAQ